LGNRKIRLQAYQVAHTESDLTVFDEKTNILWSGDLVFSERTPVVDGDIHGFIETLEEINKQEINFVVPGHGLPSSKEYAIRPMIEYLVTLRDDVRKFIDNGESLEFAIENAASSQKDDWLLFDIQNKRNVNRIFPMMEWE
jgi:glyoxylase-like metal-dependent hydrolase (beta-lactamase superfamily II)